MDPWVYKSGANQRKTYKGKHAQEHWYRDNQVYFITARCRGGFPAFQSEEAKAIFWDRFDHYPKKYDFVPWVTSLLDNHYHTLGYLRYGKGLPKLMNGIQGTTAKLVNDLLQRDYSHHHEAGVVHAPRIHPRKRHLLNENARLLPFWRNAKNESYFDGCIRDEKQARLAYRYTCIQSERHRFTKNWQTYPHTKVNIELERAIPRANELEAYLQKVTYKRYDG